MARNPEQQDLEKGMEKVCCQLSAGMYSGAPSCSLLRETGFVKYTGMHGKAIPLLSSQIQRTPWFFQLLGLKNNLPILYPNSSFHKTMWYNNSHVPQKIRQCYVCQGNPQTGIQFFRSELLQKWLLLMIRFLTLMCRKYHSILLWAKLYYLPLIDPQSIKIKGSQELSKSSVKETGADIHR